QIANESPVKNMKPLCSAKCGSLPAACRSSAGAASFFMMIPHLVSHPIFRAVV
ncbi:hypothetical protein HAX54_041029, partial [Datura stramonium]|nr:hypothetical protein [Datura stramonium]